jgi:uncharacterized protein YjaZ
VTVDEKPSVAISILYLDDLIPLILIHEYSHCLHDHYLSAKLPRTLKSSIVGEGIACYFPLLMSSDYTIYDSLWMMPKNDVDWCVENQDRIIEVISKHLDGSGMDIDKMFYIGGEHAEPPEGFPQKTAYYVGYRVIESCICKTSIQEICKTKADGIIAESSVFK